MAAAYDREDGAPPPPPPHGGADVYDPNYVPDSVKTFVVHLYRHIRDKNVYEIHQMYEGGFQRLSDRLFRDAPWPSAEAVTPYCDGDHVFLLLYRELWYRHAYARLSPLTASHRAESWNNYCDLFSVVLHGVVNMQLPNQWLWDMVDEFVYQFQSFCQYRAKLKNKTEDELQQLKHPIRLPSTREKRGRTRAAGGAGSRAGDSGALAAEAPRWPLATAAPERGEAAAAPSAPSEAAAAPARKAASRGRPRKTGGGDSLGLRSATARRPQRGGAAPPERSGGGASREAARRKLHRARPEAAPEQSSGAPAWNVYGVLNYLQALVEKSMIAQILEREKEGLEQFTATDGYDYEGGSNVLKVLGYYSMIGLLRIHCLLGDYHTGLKCLAPIDLNQQGVYTIVIGSHISTIYHYGFANLMMRRYVDSIREFNEILLYVLKFKQYHQKSPQYDQILKKNEQMYALLAICLSLCPQNKLIDENVSTQLKEKYNDKMTKMQRFDDEANAAYDELFSYACPKFITPAPPVLDQPLTNYNQDAYRLQLKLFLYEVKQQQLLSGVRSYLKLYSTITTAKLAQYMEVDETTLRSILMTYKHKMHAVDCNGKIVSSADFDFYIKEDIIHVVESKPTKRHGDYFLRQILKFEEMIGELEKVQLD